MINLLSSITMARKALQAGQVAIQTTGHNIANANTPGYTRQRVDLVPTIPFSLGSAGSVGTGVDVKVVTRLRDLMLDSQFRDAHQTLGRQETEEATLSQIEGLVGEPSDSGLASAMSALFGSFHDLANSPTDLAVRTVVRDKARALADQFHRLDDGFERLKIDLSNEITVDVKQVNGLAQQIADLNGQIARSEGGGGTANDLRDLRDQALDDLSKLVGGSVIEDMDGQVRVMLGGGLTLVDGQTTVPLEARANDPDPDSVGLFLGGKLMTPGGGRLAGLLNSRNSTSGFVKGFQSQLDALAKAVVEKINVIHVAGYGMDGITTANKFFDSLGTTARSIAVDSTIEADVTKIAAAAAPIFPAITADPGDNSNALALASLQDDSTAITLPSGTTTLGAYLSNLVSDLASQEAGAKRSVGLHTTMADFLTSRRDQASGVSLDEEMTNLIRFQKAYEAAAHFVTVVNDLLGTLMTKLG